MTDLASERQYDRKEIRGMQSVADVQEAIDVLDARIRHIKAQLEFRSDGEADDAWERRAITALSANQALHSDAIRQFNRLTGRTASNAEQGDRDRLASEMRRQNNLAEQAQAIRRKEQKQQAARIAAVNDSIRLIHSVSFHRNFYRIAQERLEPGLMAELQRMADMATDRKAADVLMAGGLASIEAVIMQAAGAET